MSSLNAKQLSKQIAKVKKVLAAGGLSSSQRQIHLDEISKLNRDLEKATREEKKVVSVSGTTIAERVAVMKNARRTIRG